MSTRKKPPLPHPIAKAIDDVFSAGHTPRIHVDARRADVTVPEHVRERWQARLVIDLDPSWPLRLEHSETGLSVDLAFSGLVSRCSFSWSAIYVVLDRATGRGTVVEAHLPPHELAPGLAFTAEPAGAPKGAKLRSISVAPPAAPSSGPSSSGPSSSGPASSGQAALGPASLGPHDRPTLSPGETSANAKSASPRRGKQSPTKEPKTEAPTPGRGEAADQSAAGTSEQQARERRARFRVIEGGG